MTRPITLDYHHGLPNRYEWEMEAERGRWLRRRFRWFCWVMLALALISFPFMAYRLTTASGRQLASVTIDASMLVLQIGVFTWALWYVRQRVKDEMQIFTIAFWLVVGLGVIGLLAMRVSTELAFVHELQMAELRAADPGEIDVRVRQGSAPDGAGESAATPPPRRVNSATRRGLSQGLSLGVLAWGIFTTHFIACLFLPWTPREAMKPAAILVATAGLIVLIDSVMGRGSIWYLGGSIVLLPLGVLPGLGWCWWRQSRFRRNFRFIFESNQFRQLRHELDGARRIHEASLPPVHRDGPLRLSYVYEPMQQIGGDLIFVHPRPPEPGRTFHHERMQQRYTMVLLDVTGHGIAAALTVNRLVGELERLFAEQPDISAAEVMACLNRYVYLTIATHGIFVTGLAISVDCGDVVDLERCYREPHDVCFASAGHPTAFVRRADGRIDPLESNAMMLGVLSPEAYEAEENVFRLRAGEAIIAYTDGATEATNRQDQMIGIEGVRDMVRRIGAEIEEPFEWPEQMIRRVASWRGGPPADDTLIACIYRPTGRSADADCDADGAASQVQEAEEAQPVLVGKG